MPFRLLGLVEDPSRAGELCGHSFARYAAAGIDVTLVFVAGKEIGHHAATAAADAVGIPNIVLLDFGPNELTSASLEPTLADLVRSVSPHVVVADAHHQAIADAAVSICRRATNRLSGNGPAKLYFRAVASPPQYEATTAVRGQDQEPRELFTRVYPSPWVTGLLERDLFAGIAPDSGLSLEQLLAG